MSSMLSSTLNPLELEEYKMLNKSEKLEELTIFAYKWGMVHRVSILKPKKNSKKPFSSSLNYPRE